MATRATPSGAHSSPCTSTVSTGHAVSTAHVSHRYTDTLSLHPARVATAANCSLRENATHPGDGLGWATTAAASAVARDQTLRCSRWSDMVSTCRALGQNRAHANPAHPSSIRHCHRGARRHEKSTAVASSGMAQHTRSLSAANVTVATVPGSDLRATTCRSAAERTTHRCLVSVAATSKTTNEQALGPAQGAARLRLSISEVGSWVWGGW